MMQGVYSNQWAPPISVSGSLPAWKDVMNDIRHSIIEAGLIETENSDIVIDDVVSLPSDGSYVDGMLEFAFDDDLQATHPVLLQMQLGCGISGGMSTGGYTGDKRRNMPRIRWRVSLGEHQVSDWVYCPQQVNITDSYANTGALATPGWAVVTYYPEKGFFGLVHGIGSVGNPRQSVHNNYQGQYIGATLTIFIQRTTNRFIECTGEGVAIYGPNLSSTAGYSTDSMNDYWNGYKLDPSLCQYVSYIRGRSLRSASSVRYQGDEKGHDIIQTQPVVFLSDSSIQSFPYLVHYLVGEIPTKEVFEIKPSNSDDYMPFIALGNETCLSSENIKNKSCFAMLLVTDEELSG